MHSKMPRRINRLSQMLRSFRVARLLLWTIWVIYRERQRVIRARERGDYEVQPNIQVLINVLVAFRQTALKLGVLMIKLGQFLSSRADLLPEQALSVLTSLQDEVPPEPFDHVVSVIENELGKPVEEVFSILERKCTAAASLGQVHKAILKQNGETVAVKVQRANIEQLVAMDLSTLRFVIWLITRFVNTELIDLKGIYREFRRTVYEEIDFATEATNARRFRDMFKDKPTIYIPHIYDEYVTKRMLVLEWVDGIKVNDYDTLDAEGVNRLEVAKRTVNAYFYQFFEEGFFHADPHPGNIFVKQGSDPAQPIIAFLDFGMVGTITNSMKKAMRDVFLSIVTRNSQMMVEALNKLGFIGEGANLVAIEQALSLMLDHYYGMTLGQVRTLSIEEVGREIENLLYGQPFRIPAQFAFSGRAISTLVGVATGLAPNFNFIEVAQPYASKFLGLNQENIGETFQQIASQLIESGRVLLTLPHSVERLISKIEAGQVEVKLANHTEGHRSRRRNARNGRAMVTGSSRVSLTLIFLGSLGGGIYLTEIHAQSPGWFCLGMAAISVLAIIFRR